MLAVVSIEVKFQNKKKMYLRTEGEQGNLILGTCSEYIEQHGLCLQEEVIGINTRSNYLHSEITV